ncbi:SDR family oxidoreductase, partial [Sphingomonas sp.]|uniref:SDR family oxidoreductase n=1 Tax=Sphingomonas sp. TaxID=28214 RepID=UPI0025FF921E
MILVNAANGQQGRLLVPKLLATGKTVRACVQSERSATALRALGVADVVVGDIADPQLIERAIKGVDTVYHVCPGIQPREREIGFAWIDAAHVAGVRHFVFSSV